MKRFKEFLEEGKKSRLKQQLAHHYLTQQSLKPSPPQIFGVGTAPNSEERNAAIAKMMKVQGGGSIIKAAKQRKKDAEKYAKKVLKKKIPNPL
jgi:hypothetical protein